MDTNSTSKQPIPRSDLFDDQRIVDMVVAFESKGEQLEFLGAVEDFYHRGIEPKLTGALAYAFRLAAPILVEQRSLRKPARHHETTLEFAQRLVREGKELDLPTPKPVDEEARKKKLDTILIPKTTPSVPWFQSVRKAMNEDETAEWLKHARVLISKLDTTGINTGAIKVFGKPPSKDFTLYYQTRSTDDERVASELIGEVLSKEARNDNLTVDGHGTDEEHRLWYRIKPR